MNNIKNISEKSEEDSQIDDNINELNPNIENKLYKDLLNKIKNSPVIVNRLDYYPNSIPLGSFCFAVSFILYGFRCEAESYKEVKKWQRRKLEEIIRTR